MGDGHRKVRPTQPSSLEPSACSFFHSFLFLLPLSQVRLSLSHYLACHDSDPGRTSMPPTCALLLRPPGTLQCRLTFPSVSVLYMNNGVLAHPASLHVSVYCVASAFASSGPRLITTLCAAFQCRFATYFPFFVIASCPLSFDFTSSTFVSNNIP
jgi:hypothetical protein